ncbi:flagellar basal body P-ring protein FlgI [Aurantimonas sp. C2-6-R+9]|uniref:flagellar basal body P-ring protein FlgI n=1 Tax=unclassified Aurantimonas TaxID=2638230 RepID=UPI002E1726E3|nr:MULTISPECIES: flagellar basal body P-ring protein FlgI [unclassified Aurantimonas]MEC5291025.1 flagellar basal body P-ring protein FlgI [Aurantimonas sp. C2-3-R2]MEC5381354.1 flagellar basal body P-ring protein FlgI [Aurantimonas sp. C2-6-R+9]MEC5412176.1 flagellar basal body P-ring protein FlgI [Aurantimonas sp. C2-4-R8]
MIVRLLLGVLLIAASLQGTSAADYSGAGGQAVAKLQHVRGNPADAAGTVRIKDIVNIRGVRANQLVGYGLVIGLQGTGDSMRNAPFTEQSMQSMLDRMGVNIRSQSSRSKNVAAVTVTAELPAFIGTGSRIDVTVSSLGDASSLMGGTLVMTPLYGADGEIYAVAQGPLAVSGFSTQGDSERLTQGVPTTGRVANGALVEREVPGAFNDDGRLAIELFNPDFKTAIRVVDIVNNYSVNRWGAAVAQEEDFRTIHLKRPAKVSSTRFIAEIGDLRIEPDQVARVVIDERTGTVVIGRDVQISTVALTHGNLTVRVSELPAVSQPEPFSKGQTVVTSETIVDAQQSGGSFAFVGGADLESVVRGLNGMGLKPTGIIAILQGIKTAGALQAELVVQ